MFKVFLVLIMANNCLLATPQSIHWISSKEEFDAIPLKNSDAYTYLESVKKTDKITVVFVRHGESLANTIKNLPGSRTSNSPLTPKGQLQAKECGQRLKSTNTLFKASYLSPTTRTRETENGIQLAIESSLIPIEKDELHEKYHGIYEQYQDLSGDELAALQQKNQILKEKEMAENMGPHLSFEEKFNYSPDPEQIESLAEIYLRLQKFFAEVAKTEKLGESILVVSHSGVLMTLFMKEAYNQGFDIDYRSFSMKNCGVLVIEVDRTGQFEVVATNGLSFKK